MEKQTLSLSQFLRYITWFRSQDLPFNGENVGSRILSGKAADISKLLFYNEIEGTDGSYFVFFQLQQDYSQRDIR